MTGLWQPSIHSNVAFWSFEVCFTDYSRNASYPVINWKPKQKSRGKIDSPNTNTLWLGWHRYSNKRKWRRKTSFLDRHLFYYYISNTTGIYDVSIYHIMYMYVVMIHMCVFHDAQLYTHNYFILHITVSIKNYHVTVLSTWILTWIVHTFLLSYIAINNSNINLKYYTW